MDKQLNIKDLYNLRLFLFLESEPQSNKYCQILLDKKQYDVVCDALFSQFPPDPNHKCMNPDCDGRSILTGHREISLPDVTDIHTCREECNC